ncbi:MAG: NAD(+) diphosphatase [Treponema sp.]|jgi:NAD+ diphosphatase|nr:NAD(+) diphosphatase [Treponema sp.]
MDASDTGPVYVFSGGELVVPETSGVGESGTALKGLDRRELPAEFGGAACTEIPGIDGTGRIAFLCLERDAPLPPRWKKVPIRQCLPLLITGEKPGPVNRLLRAYHVMQWRRDSAFCGTCGRPNADSPSELARLCPSCGRVEFPRISPAIIVIIINDRGEALLAHNRNFSPGLYSLIAGFTEAGESLEATVERETREETGIAVKDIRYIASQPWPFPNSLMLGFTARYKGGLLKPDGVEIEDARWYGPDALPGELPGNGSVARYLINRWLEGKL